MNKLVLLLCFPLLLSATKILSYNVYDRTDRVDIMITFDTPYDGKIKQSKTGSKVTIKLENASIESRKTKELTSKILSSLDIFPSENSTNIVAITPPSVEFKASKTSDAYGLRLRFSSTMPFQQKTATSNSKPPFEQYNTPQLPTKQSDGISTRYYIVITILLIGVAVLFFLKNKMKNANYKEGKTASWLFKVAQEAKNPSMPSVTIRFQKVINQSNSVVMLDFADQSYLVLMGTNNLLLDKFTDNKPVTQNEFETILQNRHKELEDFLNDVEEDEKDPMQIYKEKAANISYTA